MPLPWPWASSGEMQLTASAAQQLYGPVRARADCRVVLEPHRRPAVVEAVYGVDVALTQLLGAPPQLPQPALPPSLWPVDRRGWRPWAHCGSEHP